MIKINKARLVSSEMRAICKDIYEKGKIYIQKLEDLHTLDKEVHNLVVKARKEVRYYNNLGSN